MKVAYYYSEPLKYTEPFNGSKRQCRQQNQIKDREVRRIDFDHPVYTVHEFCCAAKCAGYFK